MTTIEERAIKFANNYSNKDSTIIQKLVFSIAHDSYTHGATEQKEIDIEKSKMCFCKICGYKECSKRNVTCIEYKEFVKLLLEES